MSINLASEPILGTIVLTRDGVLKYSYTLPPGMTFPGGATSELIFTDRAGGVYDGSPYPGTLSVDSRTMSWLLDPDYVDHVPRDSNFEVFVTFDSHTTKVRYGRVIRREVSYPLNPLAVEAPPLMYEDDLQRDQVGPRWIAKHGRVAMHAPAGTPDYAMGVRNAIDLLGIGPTLWEDAAVLWYAPTQSDTIEWSVGVCDGGDGDFIAVVCSDYSMTEFLGVRFHDGNGSGDSIQVVTGTAWDSLTSRGSSYSHIVPDNGNIYKIRYDLPTGKISVYIGAGTTPVVEWTDTVVGHGPGHRYFGGIWNGSFADPGPLMYYSKIRDTV